MYLARFGRLTARAIISIYEHIAVIVVGRIDSLYLVPLFFIENKVALLDMVVMIEDEEAALFVDVSYTGGEAERLRVLSRITPQRRRRYRVVAATLKDAVSVLSTRRFFVDLSFLIFLEIYTIIRV